MRAETYSHAMAYIIFVSTVILVVDGNADLVLIAMTHDGCAKQRVNE